MCPPVSRDEPAPTVGLPAGTRVWNRRTGSRARFETVMPHEPQYSHGCFPVRFDDWIWEKCDVSDVSNEGNGGMNVDDRSA